MNCLSLLFNRASRPEHNGTLFSTREDRFHRWAEMPSYWTGTGLTSTLSWFPERLCSSGVIVWASLRD